MFYGYESETGYVRAIWETAPTELERDGLEVLEVNHPGAPTDGYWRVANGMLVQVPGTFGRYERRKQRLAARRERRATNPDLIKRLESTRQ